jgi:uncharacterized protein
LPAAVAALASALPQETPFFRWMPDAEENPYLGLLAHADRFIVTGDSISMMVEVARLGKPLAIAALPYRNRTAGLLHRWVNARTGVPARLRAAGITRGSRDLSAMHRVLYERGLAAPLDGGFPPQPDDRLEDELPQVAAAVRALLQL